VSETSLKLQTEHLSLGLVALEGLEIPAEYEPLPEPEETGDIQLARGMYRAIRQDPTRNRPSSEALIRRLRKGQGLPRINALVDAVNHCSAALGLPFGCYDLDAVRGEVRVRLGEEGEGFEGVGRRRVNVGERYCVSDDLGPFGNPTMDSMRTRISEGTRRALIVVFAPPDHPHDRLGWVAETLTAAAGGTARTEVVKSGDAPR
jgi:DNA/RNA-binding domain of Phe-tRNA-synthetase-like protein